MFFLKKGIKMALDKPSKVGFYTIKWASLRAKNEGCYSIALVKCYLVSKYSSRFELVYNLFNLFCVFSLLFKGVVGEKCKGNPVKPTGKAVWSMLCVVVTFLYMITI